MLAICAWGGMRVHWGQALFECSHEWLPALEAIVNGGMPRAQIYEQFRALRADGKLPGMRPAYYTKLIFFLCSNAHGYIMDQWTDRSINLLFNANIQLLDGRFVSDQNDGTVYETFCLHEETVANELAEATGAPVTPEIAEMALFSCGGQQGRSWRQYVRTHG